MSARAAPNTSPALPAWQLGYLSPLPVVDAIHYEFYQAFGGRGVFISRPVPVQAFSAGSIEHALKELPAGAEYLRHREVDRIIIGGMPVSAFAGRARMLDLIGRMGEATGIEVTSDVEDIIACLRSLGVTSIVIAAKWEEEVLRSAQAYFTAAGFGVQGSTGADFDVQAVSTVVTTKSVGLAVELGISALRRHPQAEALVLGGGTWLTVPASLAIEAETARPVVSNTTAMFGRSARRGADLTGGIRRLRMFPALAGRERLYREIAHPGHFETRGEMAGHDVAR